MKLPLVQLFAEAKRMGTSGGIAVAKVKGDADPKVLNHDLGRFEVVVGLNQYGPQVMSKAQGIFTDAWYSGAARGKKAWHPKVYNPAKDAVVTFKSKVVDVQDIHSNDLTPKPAVAIKEILKKSDVDLKPHEHPYYNSDLFTGILNRAYKKVVGGGKWLFLDRLPEGVTVDGSKFLATVKVHIPVSYLDTRQNPSPSEYGEPGRRMVSQFEKAFGPGTADAAYPVAESITKTDNKKPGSVAALAEALQYQQAAVQGIDEPSYHNHGGPWGSPWEYLEWLAAGNYKDSPARGSKPLYAERAKQILSHRSNPGFTPGIQYIESADSQSEAESMLSGLRRLDGFMSGRVLPPGPGKPKWRAQAFFENSGSVEGLSGASSVLIPGNLLKNNPKKCKSCGGTGRIPCPGCKRAGFVSQACVHCYGIGGVDCPDCKGKKNPNSSEGINHRLGNPATQDIHDLLESYGYVYSNERPAGPYMRAASVYKAPDGSGFAVAGKRWWHHSRTGGLLGSGTDGGNGISKRMSRPNPYVDLPVTHGDYTGFSGDSIKRNKVYVLHELTTGAPLTVKVDYIYLSNGNEVTSLPTNVMGERVSIPVEIRATLVLSRAGSKTKVDHESILVFELLQGYSAKERVRLRSARTHKSNPEPAAANFFETFHGAPSTETVEVIDDIHEHDNLTALGQLRELVIHTESGYKLAKTWTEGKTGGDADIPFLCSSEDGNQLYIRGGNQSLDLASVKMGPGTKWNKEKIMVGEIHLITYRTRKSFDKFKDIDYFHKLGEETKVRPFLVYDSVSKLLEIVGGQYHIDNPLIGVSRGIIN